MSVKKKKQQQVPVCVYDASFFFLGTRQKYTGLEQVQTS